MARSLEISVSPACIGSGTCRRLLPAVFGSDDQRRAIMLVNPVEDGEKLWQALDRCPVEALSARDAETGEPLFP